MTPLEQWLQNGGAFISSKVGVQDLPGRGRGVIALQDIRPFEIIAKIRRNQLINFETIGHRGDEEDKKLRTSACPGPLLLTYYLYKNYNDESNYWITFMKSLPTNDELKSMPLKWPPAQRAALPDNVLEKVRHQYDQFTNDIKKISELTGKKIEDEALFKWAWMCVNTRCIYMNIPGTTNKVDKVTLAPFADFLNHTCNTGDSVKIDIDGRGLVIQSRVAYKKGDEIFLSYGPHDNATLLTEYGFVVDQNPWDCIDISSSITPKLKKGHVAALYTLNYIGDQFTINNDGSPSFRTVMAIAALLEPGLDRDVDTIQVPDQMQQIADASLDAADLAGYRSALTTIVESALQKIKKCETRINSSTDHNVAILLDNYKRILQ